MTDFVPRYIYVLKLVDSVNNTFKYFVGMTPVTYENNFIHCFNNSRNIYLTDKIARSTIEDHINGKSEYEWTRRYKPITDDIPNDNELYCNRRGNRLGVKYACVVSFEKTFKNAGRICDNILFEYMYKYGINNVRGGSITSTKLDESEIKLIIKQLNTYHNLCDKCGYSHISYINENICSTKIKCILCGSNKHTYHTAECEYTHIVENIIISGGVEFVSYNESDNSLECKICKEEEVDEINKKLNMFGIVKLKSNKIKLISKKHPILKCSKYIYEYDYYISEEKPGYIFTIGTESKDIIVEISIHIYKDTEEVVYYLNRFII